MYFVQKSEQPNMISVSFLIDYIIAIVKFDQHINSAFTIGSTWNIPTMFKAGRVYNKVFS